jgi:RNA polymerase sigma-70 factor (ECF subfamily)
VTNTRQSRGPVPQLLTAESGDRAKRAGTPLAGASDMYLVQRTRAGNLGAYAELADRRGPSVYRVAVRLLGDCQDAEDVAQEALVAAWQQLPSFRGDASFSTWLYQIVTAGP